jgi:LysM repeat protein
MYHNLEETDMKLKLFLLPILILILALVLGACVRSIATPPGRTTEVPLEEQAPIEDGGFVQIITPETETGQPDATVPPPGEITAPGPETVLCAFPPDWVPYTLQEGDTLDTLAAAYNIDPGELATSNCLYALGQLSAGTIVYLPPAPLPADTSAEAPASTPSGDSSTAATEESSGTGEESAKQDCKSPYTVRGGEWVYKIGRRCNISPYAIITYNNLRSPYWLRPGQVLLLPPNAPPFPK